MSIAAWAKQFELFGWVAFKKTAKGINARCRLLVNLPPHHTLSELSGGRSEQQPDGKRLEGQEFARIYFVLNVKGNASALRQVESESGVTSARENDSRCYFKSSICFISRYFRIN